jgi:uncharacterized protein (TIGR02145 family)
LIIYGNEMSFTTLESPYITIFSPTSSDHWMGGETHSITYADNITENVNITLFKTNVLNLTIANNISSNGQFDWTIPDNIEYGSDYHVRIFSVNDNTIIGISEDFKASEKPGASSNFDFDDITYTTKKIGKQWWMAENLKTSKYKTGTDIPFVNNTTWNNLTTPAYCNYGSVPNNTVYGALYNWYAVNTGNLCPSGWHVPTEDDWQELSEYLGGDAIAGGKLKETGTSHWNTPNTGATDEVGFTGRPGGYQLTSIVTIGTYGGWWSSAEHDINNALVISMNYNNTYLNSNYNSKKSGSSIRCIRD